MKKNINKIFVLLPLIFLFKLYASDNIKQDFIKSLRTMYDIPKFCCEIEVKTYKDTLTNIPYNSFKAFVIRDDNNILSKYFHLTMLSTDNYLIMVDSRRKKIYYRLTDSLSNNHLIYEDNLKEFLNDVSSNMKIDHIENIKQYTIFKPGREIFRAVVMIDSIKNQFDQIVYYYRENSINGKGKVVIKYNWSDCREKDLNLLSEINYIHVQGDSVTLNPNYQSYKLVKQDENF